MEQLQVLANITQGSISFNYDETKAKLSEVLAEFKGAVFSDESIKTAKVIVADLRSSKKAFNDRRISVKKEYMKTYDDFETQANEIIALFDEPINFIADQIAGFEERQKAEKKEKVVAVYNSLVGDLVQYLPLEKFYNAKWENKTFLMKDIEEEINLLISSTSTSIETIEAMNSEAVPKALELFKNDLSLANAISYINNYEKQKAEILEKEKEKQKEEEEKRKKDEEDRIRKEEREKILAEQKAEEEKQAEIEQAKDQAKIEAQAELLSIKEPAKQVDEDFEEAFTNNLVKATFTVIATDEEIQQVEMYMNSIGVEYTRG